MKTNMTSKSEDLALDYEKSEDPAKMTYSISDFSEQDPRFLPRLRELLTKNQDQDLERCACNRALGAVVSLKGSYGNGVG